MVEIPTAVRVTYSEPTMTPPTLAARQGVPTIELLPSFRAEPKRRRERLYFPQNRHWTAAGHAVAAGAIETTLRGGDLLRGR